MQRLWGREGARKFSSVNSNGAGAGAGDGVGGTGAGTGGMDDTKEENLCCGGATGSSRCRRGSEFEMCVFAANLINRKNLIDAVPGTSPHNPLGIFHSRTCYEKSPKDYGETFPEPVPPAFASPLKGPRKASSSSQIPLFVSITIARLLHHLRIYTPHTAHIGGNLTSRAHQFDPKRRMPPFLSPQMSPGWHRIL